MKTKKRKPWQKINKSHSEYCIILADQPFISNRADNFKQANTQMKALPSYDQLLQWYSILKVPVTSASNSRLTSTHTYYFFTKSSNQKTNHAHIHEDQITLLRNFFLKISSIFIH